MEEGQKGSRGLPRPGREREAPAGLCLKTRSASIPAHCLQDMLDSGMEGKVRRQCLPWGLLWESRQRKVIGGTSLEIQWLKF